MASNANLSICKSDNAEMLKVGQKRANVCVKVTHMEGEVVDGQYILIHSLWINTFTMDKLLTTT